MMSSARSFFIGPVSAPSMIGPVALLPPQASSLSPLAVRIEAPPAQLPFQAMSIPDQQAAMSIFQPASAALSRRPGPKDWSPRTGICACRKRERLCP